MQLLRESPEHECFRICTSRPIGPTNPAFSRSSKPPPLGGGVFTFQAIPKIAIARPSTGSNQPIPDIVRGGIAMTKFALWIAALGVSALGSSAANAQSMTLTSSDIKEGGTI